MWLIGSNRVSASENDADRIRNQVQIIATWLEENPQINARKDFASILFFLRNCKYDIERTKKKIKTYYLMRAERVEWFENRDPFLPEVQDLLKLGVFLPLDGVDELNRKVVVIRAAVHDPQIHTQNNVFKVGKMVLDLLIKQEPDNCSKGIVTIFDLKNVQLGHALQLTPRIIKHSVDSWKAYPCQPKLLEFINCPPHVNFILNTFRFFMTSKMRSRVVIQKHGNCSLKSENLPVELGGQGKSFEELAQKWKTIVEENADYYKEDDQYKSIINSE